ncbi:unnamed protein product [Phytomonas sp. Hart1]|nr:unnamed protein product [Phytomonas sp. Hart1]|eukprot:CCW67523.1 unnamed protein product [Phytomonas sp. isolate Hart1]
MMGEWDMLFHQLYKLECVVRLEEERREAKMRLRLLNMMSQEVDKQITFVAQFKKQWLQNRLTQEQQRQELMDGESKWRLYIEEEYSRELRDLV